MPMPKRENSLIKSYFDIGSVLITVVGYFVPGDQEFSAKAKKKQHQEHTDVSSFRTKFDLW